MLIGERHYAEKAAAGESILAYCKANSRPDEEELGEYRGFKLSLAFDVYQKEYLLYLSRESSTMIYLGKDVHGNITRMDNAIDGVERRLESAKLKLENTLVQQETAKEQAGKPFPQEDELKQKSARLDELNVSLNLDHRESDFVDDEPDEGDKAPVWEVDFEM